MKLYITRQSVSRLLFGGLERLEVWFTKPTYIERKLLEEDAYPFPIKSQEELVVGGYWTVLDAGRHERKSFSFGSVFGYGDSTDSEQNIIVAYVQQKLFEHFGNTPFGEDWLRREQQFISRKEDFLLEIDISISFNKP